MARINQKQLAAVGTVDRNTATIVATIVDASKLTFSMTGAYEKNGVNVSFEPCDDNGKLKTFGDLDDAVKFVTGALLDLETVVININNAELASKAYVPPTNPVSEAEKQKASYTRLSAGIDDNIVSANAQVAAAVASGWNLQTAHSALQARHAEFVTQADTVAAIKAFYVAKIAEYQAIITAAGG